MSGQAAEEARDRPGSGGCRAAYWNPLTIGGWLAATLMVIAPVVVLVAIGSSGPPSVQEVLTVVAASAGPAVYLGATFPACASPSLVQMLLAASSKFSATLIVASALSVIGLAGPFGLIPGGVALLLAGFVALGTLALIRGYLLGVLPLLLVFAPFGVFCLHQQFSIPADTDVLRIVGVFAMAVAVACLVLTLAGTLQRARRRAG